MSTKIYNLVSTFLTAALLCQPLQAGEDFLPRDREIYEQTLAQCNQIQPGTWSKFQAKYSSEMHHEAFIDALTQAGKSGFFDEVSLGSYILNKGISSYTHERLNSDGFISALLHCYPESEKDRNHFVISLLFHEWIGKSAAVVGYYLSIYKLLALGFQSANNFLFTKLPKFGTAANWIIKGAAIYSAIRLVRQIYGSPTNAQENQFNQIIQSVEKRPMESLDKTLDLLDEVITEIEMKLADQNLGLDERLELANKKAQIYKHKNILLKYKSSAAAV